MLRQGDLVKYHRADATLTDLGFKLGQIYEIGMVHGALTIGAYPNYGTEYITLIDNKGELTDHADHFTLVKCPLVLSRGKVTL